MDANAEILFLVAWRLRAYDSNTMLIFGFLLNQSPAKDKSMSFGSLFGGENRPSDAINLCHQALGSLGEDGSQRAPIRGVGMYHQRRSQHEVTFIFDHCEPIPLC